MDELFAYFEANKPPQVVLSAFGAVLENPVKLFCGVGNADPAPRIGTMCVKPGLYASDLLVKLLEAVRALDWKIVVVLLEHDKSLYAIHEEMLAAYGESITFHRSTWTALCEIAAWK